MKSPAQFSANSKMDDSLQRLRQRLRRLLMALIIVVLLMVGLGSLYLFLNQSQYENGLLWLGGLLLVGGGAAWFIKRSLSHYLLQPLAEIQAELDQVDSAALDAPGPPPERFENQPPSQNNNSLAPPPVEMSVTRPGVELLSQSEASYHQLAAASPYSLMIHRQQKILFVNPAAIKLLGAADAAQLIGQAIGTFSQAQAPLKSDTGNLSEQKFTRLDGTQVQVEVLETPFIYQNEPAMQLIARNISAHKRAEAEMRQRNRELTTLQAAGMTITSSLDLLHVLNTVTLEMTKLLGVESCTLSEWNRAENRLTRMARYNPDGWWNTHLAAQIQRLTEYPVTREVLEEQVTEQMTLQQPNIDPAEAAYMRQANFKTRMLLPMIFKGQVLGLVELADSRAERIFTPPEISLAQLLANQAAGAIENARLFERLAEERSLLAQRVEQRTAELSHANAELAKAARLKDEFLAGMSHELRTPLNAILGSAEILYNGTFGPLNERQLKFSRNIEESGTHLLSLINDILDLSKVEAGKMELEIGPVSVAAVCETSLRMVKQLAHKKQLTVIQTLDAQVTEIQADERRLKQMLVNLLSNAVKFTPERGRVGLEVKAYEADQEIHFIVWDTGMGIAPEDLRRLFQPFTQLDNRLARQYSGTGLGLALVARMAELHGGGITVESRVNQGSRFIISLPWVKRAGPAASTQEPDSAEPLPELLLAPNGQPYRILLADDNEANLNLFQAYLQARGCQIIVARNGQEAIERTHHEQPDLILMDVQMPEIDGLEATRRLRTEAALASMPIIAITALAMPGDRERCLEAGANDYLSKPIKLEKLLKTINTHLKNKSN